MQTKSTFKLLSALFIGLALSACGGGSGSALQDIKNNTNSSAASSAFTGGGNSSQANSSLSSVNTTTLSNIGYGTGSSFLPGVIGLGLGTSNLSAGGTTSLIVNLVSVTGNLVTTSATVTFNSPCIARGEATISQSVVVTTTGEAATVYKATGCVGDDLVTATTAINGIEVSAQTTLNVAIDKIQTISFVDANPELVNLKGTGGKETSIIRFKVLGETGAPIKGIDVNFSLSTEVGGLHLSTTTAKTDTQGYASTTVQAGTVATSVRVTATDSSTLFATQSSQLLVSTGIPDQKSMSLATSLLTPPGWTHDGIETTFTVYLADAFNNFAPDGTTVSFTTEGGSISPGCNTTNGKCPVTWRSTNPRPVRAEADESVNRKLCRTLLSGETSAQCSAKRAGRITILATAIGNESFIDVDGDGYYTPGVDIFNTSANGGDCVRNEPISTASVPTGSPIKACDDLPEAYLDKDESGTRQDNETFVDFNKDGIPSPADGQYNGALCKTPGAGCTQDKVTIRREETIIMACDNPLTDPVTGLLPDQDTHIALLAGQTVTKSVVIADCNGNSIPAGATITADVSSASNVSANVSNPGPIADGLEPITISITYKASDTKDPSGVVYIKVIANGLTSQFGTLLN